MTTSTKELIHWLAAESKFAKEDESPVAAGYLREAAQRLRELNKPDCVWHKVGETFDTACNARYRDGAYSVWKTCPNCGGAVKEGV